MKKFGVLALMLLCVLAFSMQALAQRPGPKKFSPVSRLSHSGDIVGILQCVEDDDPLTSTPDSEALIYIPGKSFVVKTPIEEVDGVRSGEFRIYNVPRGTYDLVIEIPEQVPVVVPDVEVLSKKVTDLGVIDAICPAPPISRGSRAAR